MSILVTRKPRRDGVTRRLKIVAFLRENPGASHLSIARGVGLATHNSYSSILETHLATLTAEGLVRDAGGKWVAV